MADVEVEVEVAVDGEPVQQSETEAATGGEPQVTESQAAEQGEKEKGGEEGEKEAVATAEGAGEESDSDEEAETEDQKTTEAGEEPPQAAAAAEPQLEEVKDEVPKEKEASPEPQEQPAVEPAPLAGDGPVQNGQPQSPEREVQNGDAGAAQNGQPRSPVQSPEREVENGDATPAQSGDAGGGSAEQEARGDREGSVSPLPGVPVHIGEYLQMMQVGTDMVKVKKTKTYVRIYKLEGDLLGITWNSRTKRGNKARIAIKQIHEIRSGRSTETFKHPSHAEFPEDKCFSIIYTNGGKHQSLDLVALSAADALAWRSGLETLIKMEDSGAQRSRVRERWLRDLFEDADRNGDGTLDLKEVIAMLRRLNVGVSKKVIKQKFKEADTEGSDQTLDFEEFCSLFKELATRPEVNRLFQLYSSKKEWLTAEDLKRFLEVEQGVEDASPEYCSELIQQYEATDQGKAEGLMSVDGFTHFLLGPENDLFNQSHRQVYQDMSQPLSHYHIASSHNTYLLEDQLRGPSSVEAYIRALRKGCRCVELDCWDGDDDEPVIYHGHTLTSKILFKDVIVALKEHAFTASPYPVILSIENHCSVPQQTKMAEYFEDILGDMLYKDPVDQSMGVLPSPESLKGKILIKGKKLSAAQEEEEDGGEVSEEDEAAEVDLSKLAAEKGQTPPKETATPAKEGATPAKEGAAEGEGAAKKEEEKKEGEGAEKEEGKQPAKEGAEAVSSEAAGDKKPEGATAAAKLESPAPKKERGISFRRKRPQPADKPKKKVKLSVRLSKCINYVQSVHFKGFDDWGEEGKFYQMSSFGESSAVKYSSHGQATHFMVYNKRQLSRTYPAGRRVDSSNYNPVDMWNSGCQIVALNYQTQDLAMDLNDGKFCQNGGSGYTLKPWMMREDMSCFDFHQKSMPGLQPKLYTVSVISAQTLPKPPGGSKTGEVIDPYIVINTYGRREDQVQYKTKTVQDNGFNPVWNETFHFVVHAPDYTLIRFKVMDEDWGPNQDDFIGQFTAPLESIMPGHRHIHLTCSGDPLENASIFLHVSIQDYIAPSGGVKGAHKMKKSREYPAVHPVHFPAVDSLFLSAHPLVRQAVDLKEDYMYGLQTFKHSCGRGTHAVLADCVQLMAARAKASQIALHFQIVGEATKEQVYKAGITGETSPPQTLVAMITAFNLLNGAIQSVLLHGEKLAADLGKTYTECRGHRDDLKTHLTQTGASSRKIIQTMENYGFMMCTLTFQATEMQKLKEQAEADVKKILAASVKYDIELKTSL